MESANIDIPTLVYEHDLQAEGVNLIAGVDEVGRGALAGPLMAAAVMLPPPDVLERDIEFWRGVRDSKTLSATKRSFLAAEILARADSCSTAAIEPDELDDLGVGPANRIAMERAVLALPDEPEVLLIDAMTIESSIWQIGIIDGDAISLSIAAASIIAKVARDTLMIESEVDWPVYGFARHKGYGVPSHISALREHGPCTLHRRCFAPVRLAEEMARDRQET